LCCIELENVSKIQSNTVAFDCILLIFHLSPSTSSIFFSILLRVLPTVFDVCAMVAAFCSSGPDL